MTALVDREVEGNFSTVVRYWTGLSAAEPNEPSRQDFGDFVEPFGSGHLFGRKSVAHRVTVRTIDDCPRMTTNNSKIKTLAKRLAKETNSAKQSANEETLRSRSRTRLFKLGRSFACRLRITYGR
jgi:hypothetical protein